MTYRRGGKPGGGTDKLHFIECPACACPNRPTEQKCMFCQSELQGTVVAIRGHLYPYLHNIRAFFSFHQPPDEVNGWLRSGLTLLLAAGFMALGVTFTLRGISYGGYFNWTVGILLLIYGVAAARNSWGVFFRR